MMYNVQRKTQMITDADWYIVKSKTRCCFQQNLHIQQSAGAEP